MIEHSAPPEQPSKICIVSIYIFWTNRDQLNEILEERSLRLRRGPWQPEQQRSGPLRKREKVILFHYHIEVKICKLPALVEWLAPFLHN